MSNTIQTDQLYTHTYKYQYIHSHTITLNLKGGNKFENWEGYMGEPKGKKRKGEMLQLYYFKNKSNKCNFIMCKLFCL